MQRVWRMDLAHQVFTLQLENKARNEARKDGKKKGTKVDGENARCKM
jgi:hypothetical protein